MNRAVIDASVVLKWYLDDEEYGQKALNILAQFVSGELDIIAPSLLEYEVMNGLIIAQKRRRVKEEKILTALEGFRDLEVEFKNCLELFPKIVEFCKKYNRSAYDASYIAVAQEERIPFVTSDQGLYNAVKKDLRWVKWIGDIEPA